jgi:hypothetical protein
MEIVFRFTGGPLDGQIVRGSPREESEAERYYLLSHHGRIGQHFRVASSYAVDVLAEEQLQQEHPHRFQQHSYEVIDCVETVGRVLVRAKYVRPEDRPKDLGGCVPL